MLRRLFATPLAGVAIALLAGASAAHDFAIHPRFDLLFLFAAYALAVVALEMRVAHAPPAGAFPWANALLAAIALIGGTTLTVALGWPAFWIALALALLALAFVAGPRLADTALAGPVTILALGPLISAGAALAVAGHVTPVALAIGLPVGLLADAVRRAARTGARAGHAMHSAHAQPYDTPPASPWFATDLLAAFGIVPVLVGFDLLPWPALACWLALPLALAEPARVRTGAYAWGEAATRMRRLHLVFGVLLAAAVLIARVVVTRAV
jgi:hypothetical protein